SGAGVVEERAGARAGGRGSRSIGGAGRGVLRPGATRARPAHPRRHGPGVLWRRRGGGAGGGGGGGGGARAGGRLARGGEGGARAEVPSREFGLYVGETVEFRFLSSSTRKGDKVGDFIEEVSEGSGVDELAPVETVLPAGEGEPPGTMVPVRLSSHVSEVG